MKTIPLTRSALFAVAMSLTISNSVTAAVVEGTVVDSAGRPVAGASVRLWNKRPTADNTGVENVPINFDGHDDLKSDAEGRFQTPDVVDSELPVRLVAMAEGHVASRSGWIAPGEQPVIEVEPIVLVRLRGVSGRVLDRRGLPVAGVKIFHAGDAHASTSTFTDEEGRWALAGVPEGLAFVFAEKDGYRFTGQRLGPAADSVEVTLSRPDESIEPILTRAPVLSRDEELALARQLLEPYLQAVAKSGSDRDKSAVLSELGRIDPLEAFDRLVAMQFAEPAWREKLLGTLAILLMEQPDAAWEDIHTIIESSEDRGWSASNYVRAVVFRPHAMRTEKIEWLNQASLHARAVEKAADRSTYLAWVGAKLYELEQDEQAAMLVEEAVRIAEELPPENGGIAYDAVAEALVHRDFDSALRWLAKIRHDSHFASASGGIALEFAGTKPDKAEQLWNLTNERLPPGDPAFELRDVNAASVCFKMAGRDAGRARRVAQAIDDPLYRMQALAAVAAALAGTEPATARTLLLEASEIVAAEIVGRTEPGNGEFKPEQTACSAMAWLLPIAERIDAQLGRELLWRALAVRLPRPEFEWLDDEGLAAELLFAQMLARYEPELARAIIESLAHASSLRGLGEFDKSLYLTAAATIVDPRWALELIDNLADAPDGAIDGPKNVSRRFLVRGLAGQGASRWQQYAGFWEPELIR